MRPKVDMAASIMASTWSFWDTSASTGSARTPSSSTAAAVASASSRLLRAFTTMLAPSAAIISAVARPMLRPDPVINATLPSSLPILITFLNPAGRRVFASL